jgi:hypothetical protein
VNLGRTSLAESLGFVLPRRLERKRELWEAIAQYVTYWYDHTEAVRPKLEMFRDDRARRGRPE